MSGIAAARDRYDPPTAQRVSGWERNYLRGAALANLGCAIIGVFVAAQLRFGDAVTGTRIALSLALPVLSPALLYVACRRTSISPTTGPTLLHVDHLQIAGLRLVLKDLIDRCAAAAVLIVLFPLTAVLSAMTRLRDCGACALHAGQSRQRWSRIVRLRPADHVEAGLGASAEVGSLLAVIRQ